MNTFSLQCPVMGYKDTDVVTLAHGSGGESMQKLIKNMFVTAFPHLQSKADAARIVTEGHNLTFTTDSFVINPIFFPGGDIGSLSVHGTVNDLAMSGAQAKWLALSFILEEGFLMKDLETIVHSVASAADKVGVKIITGDTKVVDCVRTKLVTDDVTKISKTVKDPGIYINTTGIGEMRAITEVFPDITEVKIGDKIIVSGDIGRHGMAIMSVRNGLELDPPILSDSMALNGMVRELYYDFINPHFMRDATRGGLATVLNEVARDAEFHIRIDEEKVPVADDVRGLAEILGYDALVLANEGRFVLFVKAEDAEKTVKILHTFEGGEKATIIGEVVGTNEKGLVTAKTLLGNEKPIHMPAGEILPRIC